MMNLVVAATIAAVSVMQLVKARDGTSRRPLDDVFDREIDAFSKPYPLSSKAIPRARRTRIPSARWHTPPGSSVVLAAGPAITASRAPRSCAGASTTSSASSSAPEPSPQQRAGGGASTHAARGERPPPARPSAGRPPPPSGRLRPSSTGYGGRYRGAFSASPASSPPRARSCRRTVRRRSRRTARGRARRNADRRRASAAACRVRSSGSAAPRADLCRSAIFSSRTSWLPSPPARAQAPITLRKKKPPLRAAVEPRPAGGRDVAGWNDATVACGRGRACDAHHVWYDWARRVEASPPAFALRASAGEEVGVTPHRRHPGRRWP